MPQESLRSAVYRSFVSCDDPKGVVESKTIRKSKPKKTHSKNGEQKLKDEEEKKLQAISSFKIMEVSRGADKLNEIVDKRSKFAPQDLLKGALHLQESLLALQQSKKMPVALPSAPRRQDCYDELREVIRESFARQKNILPDEEKKEGSCMDLPSTSSSRSSSLICSGHHSSGASSSSHEKPRGHPNLIAKLMGLDEAPFRRGNLRSFIQKEKGEEKGKFSSFVDIDLFRPRPKKEGRKLEEMVETVEFKGLLGRKNSLNDVSLSRESSAADDPPIVIMKPLRNLSIYEEKRVIKSSKILKRRNLIEVQVPRPRKKQQQQLDKYTSDRAPMVKTNHHKPLVPRVPKKESVVKKIDDCKLKIAPHIRKREEAKDTKDVGKKLSTLKRESNVSKGQNAEQKESIKRASLKPSFQNKNLGKKTKPKSKPSASLVENVLSGVIIESNIQECLMKNIAEEVINPCSNVSISGSPCESSEPISTGDVDVIEDESCKSTRRLLLSSASFLTHVEEEFFDTGTCVFPSGDTDKEAVDDPLLLDCAKELLSRKSLRCRNTRMVKPSSYLLLDDDKSVQELVGEISDGIECLRKYSKCCGDVVEDSIYPMLERDLWGDEELIGAWDLGWRRDGYTMEAMKEVVYDIEKLMLRELVGDVVVEFIQQL